MTDTPLVERLRGLAAYIDQIDGPLTIREEGDRRYYREAAAALDAMDKRIAELEAALEPFAHYGKLASRRDDAVELSLYTTLGGQPDGIDLTVADFRRANRLLSSRPAPISAEKEAE